MTILSDAKALSQQIRLDNLPRSLIQSDELVGMLKQDVCSVTSSPAIFQKIFADDPLYADGVTTLKQKDLTPEQRYRTVTIVDMQAVCNVCLLEHESTGGKTGFVSLEITPEPLQNAAGTIEKAKRLHAAINCKNVMIKVPTTDAGVGTPEALVAEGISINLTLLSSRTQILKAYAAYTRGIAECIVAGLPIDQIHVMASFFISCVDDVLDAALPDHPEGKITIALAKTAYQDQGECFGDAEFAPLATKGANRVQFLQASTGMKNPTYPNTLYADSLVGASTVGTVPDATLKASINYDAAKATLDEGTTGAKARLAKAGKLGADLGALATRLQEDGLKRFEEAFAKLLALLA